MANTTFIRIETICTHNELETIFIEHFHDAGLIKIHIHEKKKCIQNTEVHRLDKIIRLHQDLQLNPEGIDVVLNLLDRIEAQQTQIQKLNQQLERLGIAP